MDKLRGLFGFVGLWGVFLFGCGIPEFRVEVQSIPAATTQLEVAAYVQGALVSYAEPFAVTGPLDDFSFGVRLRDSQDGDTTISVAARDAGGCILAVGTSDPAQGSVLVTKVTVPLSVPAPAKVDTICKPGVPVIMAAIRREEGPLSDLQNSIELQGWNFSSSAQVAITSSAQVRCTSDTCKAVCQSCGTTGMGTGGGGPDTSQCVKDCPVIPTLIPHGPALLEMSLDPSLNVIQPATTTVTTGSLSPPPIDLLTLISQALTITLTNPDPISGMATFTEVSDRSGMIIVH